MERTTEDEVRAMFISLVSNGFDVVMTNGGWQLEIRGEVPPFALVPQIYLATYRNGKQPHRSQA